MKLGLWAREQALRDVPAESSGTAVLLLCASAASPDSSLGTVLLPRRSCGFRVPICCHPNLSFCGPFCPLGDW